VDGGLLAVHTATGVTVANDRCRVVRTIPLQDTKHASVLLEARTLLVARPGLLEAYDATSGTFLLQRSLPPGYVVDGVAGGVVALHRGGTIKALRLNDGRSASFTPCHGPARAAVDRTGLYYSYRTSERQGRLAFVPRADLERRLAAGIDDEPRCLRSAGTFATAPGPAAVAAGDLNGDGRSDLVTAEQGFGGVTILLRDGRGFDRRDYRCGGSAYALAAADLDNDGDLDVVTTLVDRKAVAVLLNRGDGSFGPPRRYRVGSSPQAVAVGDLDFDGVPDVAVANSERGSVSILRNRGDGTFARKVDRGVGESPSSLAIEDVTGDGKADVVIAHALVPKLTVLRGAGDGSFGRARSQELEDEAIAASFGEVSGDGREDFVIIRNCAITFAPGLGGGRFGREREVADADEEECPTEVAVGDLDGDGRADLASTATSYDFPSTVSVYLNRGHGRFGPPRSYEVGANDTNGSGLAIHDLNGDGRPDLAVTNADHGFVAVLMNTLGVCRVRGLRGTTPRTARAELTHVHCRAGAVRRVFSKRVPRGRVVSAEPRFGAFWPSGAVVDLVVSRGADG
jgi:hypothetical protein